MLFMINNQIIREPCFETNPEEAIINGCEKAENEFLNKIALNRDSNVIVDKSGSCAIFGLFFKDEIFIANVGDSRAFISSDNGQNITAITVDHKPNEVNELKRILSKGGKVYQSRSNAIDVDSQGSNMFLGPHRVSPGRLSVSRTFGDAEAKLSKFGGIEGVVVATPDVFKLKLKNDTDFIMMGCKLIDKKR